jgi:hypothetical protein
MIQPSRLLVYAQSRRQAWASVLCRSMFEGLRWSSCRRTVAVSVLGLWLLGVVVRLLGLRLGLPYLHHWDECWVVWSARHMLETNTDLPTSYQYGAILSRAVAFGAELSALLPEPYRVRPNDEVALRWVGRIVSVAISSTGTVALYFAGRRAAHDASTSHGAGLVAAAAYAFGYELVTHGRYGVPDASVVSLGAWTLAATAEFLHTRQLRFACLSILAAAAAFAVKFPGLPLVLVPMVALLWGHPGECRRHDSRRIALLLAALPIALGCFLLLNPHFVDRTTQAMADLTGRMAQTRDGGFSFAYRREPGLEHLTTALWGLFAHTFGQNAYVAGLVCTVSLVGMGVAIRRRSALVIIATVHALLVLAGFSLLTRTFLLRNYLVVVPALCLGFGVALTSLPPLLAAPRARLVASMLGAGLLVTLAVTTLWASLMNQRLSKDTRMAALDFVAERTTGPGATVAFTQSVLGPREHVGAAVRAELRRPGVSFVGTATTCAALARMAPDYAISTSYRGRDVPTTPFVEEWYLRDCPGYQVLATFPFNPYEASLWVSPTWAGRASTIVLGRRAELQGLR